MPAVSTLPASTRPSGAGSTESSRPSAVLSILLALLGLGAMATNPGLWIMSCSSGSVPHREPSLNLVAGAGFEPATSGL